MFQVNFSDLNAVNSRVNELPYDFCVAELWNVPTDHAACSNYAVEKMHRLIDLGWPKESLRLACCYVETGEYHAVLCVDWEGQTWVLDNRNSVPVEYDLLPYRFDKLWSWELNCWESVS